MTYKEFDKIDRELKHVYNALSIAGILMKDKDLQKSCPSHWPQAIIEAKKAYRRLWRYSLKNS